LPYYGNQQVASTRQWRLFVERGAELAKWRAVRPGAALYLAGDQSSVTTGAELFVDGGATQL
jgi:hypothetical protein